MGQVHLQTLLSDNLFKQYFNENGQLTNLISLRPHCEEDQSQPYLSQELNPFPQNPWVTRLTGLFIEAPKTALKAQLNEPFFALICTSLIDASSVSGAASRSPFLLIGSTLLTAGISIYGLCKITYHEIEASKTQDPLEKKRHYLQSGEGLMNLLLGGISLLTTARTTLTTLSKRSRFGIQSHHHSDSSIPLRFPGQEATITISEKQLEEGVIVSSNELLLKVLQEEQVVKYVMIEQEKTLFSLRIGDNFSSQHIDLASIGGTKRVVGAGRMFYTKQKISIDGSSQYLETTPHTVTISALEETESLGLIKAEKCGLEQVVEALQTLFGLTVHIRN